MRRSIGQIIAAQEGQLGVGAAAAACKRPAHVRQRHNWDCGVACLAGILSQVSMGGEPVKPISCAEASKLLPPGACESQSVWTIDLAYGLQCSGFNNFLITTTSDGVDPSHAELGFYSNAFDEDEKRVNELIRNAAQNGIEIYEESVDVDELARFLMIPGNVAIALVNSSDLHCERCSNLGIRMLQCLSRYLSGGYVGHYILLYGYQESGHFLYLDPGHTHTGCQITGSNLERARKARGTDEDLIFVSTDPDMPF